MAVDTRNKRFSLVGFGSPIPRVLPNPDGGFSTSADRAMLLYLYALEVSPPVPPTPSTPTLLFHGRRYRSSGLTVLAQDPLYYSTRTFSERIQASAYGHEIRSIGGYWSARITIKDSKRKIEDWIDYGLGRHIEIYSPGLDTIWEGFVNLIRANLGPFQITIGPLLDIKNRVSVVYSTIDTSVTPPLLGIRDTTAVANNTTSQARYGIIETRHSTDGETPTGAAQLRDLIVNNPSDVFPPTSRDSSLSGGGASVELECAGYWAWLSKYNYTNLAGSGDTDLSTKMQAVLAASPNTLFSTDYSMITDNTTQVQAYEDGNRTAEAILKELNSKGDASFNSYTMGLYSDRRLYYQPVPMEIAYQQRITGNRGIVNPLDLVIRPWNVMGARWIFYPDFLVGRRPPINAETLGTDPRAGFIETVSFTAPYGISVNGVKLNTLDQVLVRRGLGGVA